MATVKKSITLTIETMENMGLRTGGREKSLSSQIVRDLTAYHALLDAAGLEIMIDGLFNEPDIDLLLRATARLEIPPGKVVGVPMRIAAALTEHMVAEDRPAIGLLTNKIKKLSIMQALWLWDTVLVYRANSSRHVDEDYKRALFRVG